VVLLPLVPLGPLMPVVVDCTGGPPGSCDIVFVRVRKVPCTSFSWVCALLQVPPGSCAWFIVWPFSTLEFPCTPLWLIVRPEGAAALPPTPRLEPVWPFAVELPPMPSEEAEVSPAAAEPPEPRVLLVPAAPVEDPPDPTVEVDMPGAAALPPVPIVLLFWAAARLAPPANTAAAIIAERYRRFAMIKDPWLSSLYP
jgi:hypothetical protein